MTTMTEGGFPTDVVEYLSLHHVVTLSTSSFTGMPHADTVVYVSDQWRIYFFGVDGSSLVRNVKDSRFVSFTIDDYTTDWRKVRELQGVGRCQPTTDAEEERWALWLSSQKFGAGFSRPPGVLYRVVPTELHFVDYDYATVTGQGPEVTDRVLHMEGAAQVPSHGAVSTSLDRTIFEVGQVIFRPGDQAGQYFVVVEGEVEIRAEGHGADQTVTRVGPGQLFGDRGTLRGQQGALTAHAVTRTVLLAVERDAMRDLLLPSDQDR
jgi:nitroimidazol reductase NimA-like FMN-containing flavoprotein (pyridoxamine 5'-phosphate oxidase superfamily)